MLTQLLPNLEECSVIIMDNAPYNSVLEKPLTWSCRKDEITWLQGKGIPLTEVSFKAQ
jgi:hypothetical protein